ncbi:MAG: universal stress protein [bacterium]
MISIQQILMPTDFSHNARYALDIAVNFAEKFEAQIFLLHVFEMPLTKAFNYQHFVSTEVEKSQLDNLFKAETEDAMEALVRQFASRGVPIEPLFIEDGVPFVEIIRTAKELPVDLIVMSAYSRMGISNLLIGSVTEKVVRKAPCPVLTVRSKG